MSYPTNACHHLPFDETNICHLFACPCRIMPSLCYCNLLIVVVGCFDLLLLT